MPVIAGLDVATRSGIAVFDGGKLIHASSHRPAGKESAEILHGFRVWLRPLLLSHGVEAVAIEKPIPPNAFGRKRKVVKDRNLWGGADVEHVVDEVPTNFETILRLHELFGHAVEQHRAHPDREPVRTEGEVHSEERGANHVGGDDGCA